MANRSPLKLSRIKTRAITEIPLAPMPWINLSVRNASTVVPSGRARLPKPYNPKAASKTGLRPSRWLRLPHSNMGSAMPIRYTDKPQETRDASAPRSRAISGRAGK
ncbi:hypothetical protein D3C76_1303220 [compost metagenome]